MCPEGKPAANAQTRDARIRRAIELLESVQIVALEDVAIELNLSVSRFRHLFKKELGMSPLHYARRGRLQKASFLILNSFLSIKEIAYRVGFNDVSHFVRDYKAHFGHTPSESRALAPRDLPKRA
jgi:transcriptional regulator GlxA family with amidase domain